MEYLDTYDENKNFLGTYPRDEVHEKGLWHNTVHCWLYDKEGNVYFQVRSYTGRMYTSASGHVGAGETIQESFIREIKEELGIGVDYNGSELIDVIVWRSDKEKNGKLIKDRAFVNLHLLLIDGNKHEFSFQDDEVIAVGKLNVLDVLKLFNNEVDRIEGTYITDKKVNRVFTRDDFLCLPHETLMDKYGRVLNEIKKRIYK